MEIDLAKIDLNLLVALDVLLEERSVSRAAGRLFVTQPAMSQTLRRLRELFGDALMVRVKGGMEGRLLLCRRNRGHTYGSRRWIM